MLRLYDVREPGNACKVRLLLHPIGIEFESVAVDILKGESRTPEFLALHPNGRVPAVEWPDGRVLTKSSAMLNDPADGTALLPDDPWGRVLQ